jgi:hypothetical protein
VVVAPAVMHIL